jgi:Ca2+-binding RTX toxin-like protein
MPFPAVLNLSALDGTIGFRIMGPNAYDRTGFSVASAGDINGDGIDDVIIGGPRGANGAAAYVVFGSRTPFGPSFDMSNLNGANGFRIVAPSEVELTGYSVASAGDVNGDGIDDLIVGAPDTAVNGVASGAAYVVFGRDTGFSATVDLSPLDGSNGFLMLGLAAGDSAGLSVASAGDFNDDGIADFIVGAPNADPNVDGAGASYVVFGRDTGFGASVDLAGLTGANGFRIDGPSLGDFAGRVASAGDVNGDGIDDLIIGAISADVDGLTAGAAFVVFGSSDPFGASLNLADLDGTNGFRISGRAASDRTGGAVAAAGDINGDGIGDLIIGAREADPNADRSGASYVVFGRDTGFAPNLDLATLDGSNGFRIAGLAFQDQGGHAVSAAGDLNGDGLDDLVVTSPLADPNTTASGSTYVIFGAAGGFGPDFDLSTLNGSNGFRLDGVGIVDFSGYAVASAGDVNGDGLDDLIVGAVRGDEGGRYSGTSYIIYGRAESVIFLGTAATDTVDGAAGDDQLSGLGSSDVLNGLAGNDVLDGGDAKDFLYGGDGADTLVGGAGDDLLDGGTGDDQMAGGLGDDTYVVDSLDDVVTEAAGEGQDRVRSSVTFTLGATLEHLQLTGAADINGSGNELGNQIDGNSGVNNISGNGGADLIRGHGGDDVLRGNDGDDQILGGDGADNIRGGVGADRLEGGAGADLLSGDDGNDIIDGGSDNDVLYGDSGADQLSGGDGNDILLGGDGNDVLNGGAGVDELRGGGGDDTFFVAAGDVAAEGANEGVDTVRSAGDWVLGENFERLMLDGAGDFAGTGNALANQITGNGGANLLDGAAGNDNINGGLGADRIIGGTGNDILTGGGGIDTFVVRQESVYSSSSPQGRVLEVDTIADYQIGVDIIDLSAIASGDADGAFNLVSNFDGVAGRMTLKFAGGVTSLSLDIDGDSKADYLLKINGDLTGESGRWLL